MKFFNRHPKIKSALIGAATSASLILASAQLKHDEGLVLHPYRDTVGVWTAGYGRNLNNGFRPDEVELMFNNDLREAEAIAKKFAAEAWEKLNPAQQAVVINMAFNLGEKNLFQFVHMRRALRSGDPLGVVTSMENSLWCRQVKDRCRRLKEQWLSGMEKHFEVKEIG